MDDATVSTSISARAKELQSLVDVLLPGDDHFPPASAVGAHGLLAERLRDRLSLTGVDDVLAAVMVATGGVPLAGLDEKAQVNAIRRFEREERELFAVVRNVLYYSYYQSPLVVEAVRGLGIDYNHAPQPLGYVLEPFDPTPGMGVPSQPRGFYLATDEVKRVELPPAACATLSKQ
jgi:hypothetical protein